jgi:hypothetical protein
MLELAVLRKEKQTMICRYGRTGIYHMQDVMKIINEGITNRSVLFLYLNWSTGCTQNKLFKNQIILCNCYHLSSVDYIQCKILKSP